jgi:hypothetical protein
MWGDMKPTYPPENFRNRFAPIQRLGNSEIPLLPQLQRVGILGAKSDCAFRCVVKDMIPFTMEWEHVKKDPILKDLDEEAKTFLQDISVLINEQSTFISLSAILYILIFEQKTN